MKIRAYETVTVAVDGIPQITGFTLDDWKNLLVKGITRAVNVTGRNLNDWDAHESNTAWKDKWVKVPAQPDHEVNKDAVTFHLYKHGGKTVLQAVYFFEIED
jgi:hypothetical protein